MLDPPTEKGALWDMYAISLGQWTRTSDATNSTNTAAAMQSDAVITIATCSSMRAIRDRLRARGVAIQVA